MRPQDKAGAVVEVGTEATQVNHSFDARLPNSLRVGRRRASVKCHWLDGRIGVIRRRYHAIHHVSTGEGTDQKIRIGHRADSGCCPEGFDSLLAVGATADYR